MNNEEVDLLTASRNFVLFIKKNAKVLIISFIVFLILGIGDYFWGTKYYKTSLVATSPFINKQIVYELISPIQHLIETKQYDSVANELNIDFDVSKSIRRFDMDTSINNAVKINIQIYDKEKLDTFANGLMLYINNIPYIKNTLESKRRNIKGVLDNINSEINELNKLQNNVIRNSYISGNNMIYNGDMFSEMLELYDRKIILEEEYSKLQSFRIISSKLYFKPNKNLLRSIFISIVLGLCVGFVIALVRNVKRKDSI